MCTACARTSLVPSFSLGVSRLPWERRLLLVPPNRRYVKGKRTGGTRAPPSRINPRYSPSAGPDSQVHPTAYTSDSPATGHQCTPHSGRAITLRQTQHLVPCLAPSIGAHCQPISLHVCSQLVSLKHRCSNRLCNSQEVRPHASRLLQQRSFLVLGAASGWREQE